jgi:hypothetical protein
MQDLWKGDIRLELPMISCDGMEFYSLNEAGDYFNISSERVRQKLNSDKYFNWIYL